MTMPAGNYYIGDLCYVFDDTEWDEFCQLTIKGQECLDGEFTMEDGRRFATYGTFYGDGEYTSNMGTKHCVDAGIIGCVLVSDIRANKYADMSNLGAIINFNEPFNTSEVNGKIHIGHVVIDTKEEYYDSLYDEEEY